MLRQVLYVYVLWERFRKVSDKVKPFSYFLPKITVEMEDMLFSGFDLDRVFNMQTKNGRIIFTIKY
jgi:hypothetical protein